MKNLSNIAVIITISLLTINVTLSTARENNIEIGIDEQLNDTIPRGIELTNDEGEEVILNDLIDKPTVISFVYYRCPGLCSPLMDGIAEVIDRADMKIGEDYQVFTISFDPSEYTELAAQKKINYLTSMERKEAAREGWRFFTADSGNIARLTDAMGFRYKRTGKDFLHSASLMVVSPNGKITRYLNGTYFLPFEFKMAIIEASKGQSGPTINKILQYCYSYDPAGQQYVLNITKVAGGIIMLIALVLFLVLALKPIFRRKKVSG